MATTGNALPSMPLDIVLLGCGTVGSALLSQLASQAERLKDEGMAPRLVTVTNSRSMVVDAAGLDAASWKEALSARGEALDLERLMALSRTLANPILVDCTASDALPDSYVDFMRHGFHIVTANKKGGAGGLDRYQRIHRTAKETRRRYLYEATVGAGLPVMDNLHHLLLAGDRLERFSGILSGSLSYLLGRIEDGAKFSEALASAMSMGYTEPDPRDDLSGADVARKVLILAREAGLPWELSDIALEGLLPPEYLTLDKKDFIHRAGNLDARFEAMRREAADKGQVLRFVGSIEGGKGAAGLRAVGPGDPLYAIKGGENALSFTTRYYANIPLVIRGYGAGAEVTAAAVFADILRTVPYTKA